VDSEPAHRRSITRLILVKLTRNDESGPRPGLHDGGHRFEERIEALIPPNEPEKEEHLILFRNPEAHPRVAPRSNRSEMLVNRVRSGSNLPANFERAKILRDRIGEREKSG